MHKSSLKHNKASLVVSSSNWNDTKRRKIEIDNHQLLNTGSSFANTGYHNIIELCKGNSTYHTDVNKLGEYWF